MILTGTLLGATPAMSTISSIGWRLAKWLPTDTSGVNQDCVPSPEAYGVLERVTTMNPPITVAFPKHASPNRLDAGLVPHR